MYKKWEDNRNEIIMRILNEKDENKINKIKEILENND